MPFYGSPVPSVDDIDRIKAPTLAIYAELDRTLSTQMAPVKIAMLQRQKTFGFVVYQGVNHAFHNDTSPAYNAEAACAGNKHNREMAYRASKVRSGQNGSQD